MDDSLFCKNCGHLASHHRYTSCRYGLAINGTGNQCTCPQWQLLREPTRKVILRPQPRMRKR